MDDYTINITIHTISGALREGALELKPPRKKMLSFNYNIL